MLDELKNYLDITWDDDDTNKKISQLLDRALKIIKGYACNQEIDYTVDLFAKQLLFDLCRLIYNNAYEDFGTNFAGELLLLRAKYRILNTNLDAEDGVENGTETT